MKLTIDLEDVEGWDGVSVADTIRAVVQGEVERFVKKQVREALKRSEKEIASAVKDLAETRVQAALKGLIS